MSKFRRVFGFVVPAAGLMLIIGGLAIAQNSGNQPEPGDPDWQPRAAEFPDDGKLRIIVFGAHPDDATIRAGGTAAKWAKQGHHVKFVAMTNGDVGHWQMAGGALAMRRTHEVEKAAKIMGIDEVEVMDIHDGELMPTLENRKKMVRKIREWGADLVIAHRPNDYHPDHRYTGILMQDAAYMVTVPFFCPDTPYLDKNPVFMYGVDGFQRPNPFRADVIVSIDEVIDTKVDALGGMESQFLEGGCCSPKTYDSEAERDAGRQRVRDRFKGRFSGWADTYRDRLVEAYGPDRGGDVQYAEAFEICEYGTQPDAEMLSKLFPFEGMSFEGE